ncbi:MAG TPA: 7,8-didemethyl-8-hydroxy-5-deazariboflavin synthase CofG [Acidimicrobiia bacterium]|jgi:FO synthase|nr:7,8-didemethyl-8-hydroxy-5-deazariboflavin synthase CofG [Acidimicrobiia bacterium]
MHPAPDPDLALAYLDGRHDPAPLFIEARRLGDEGKGNTVTYSRKVFIPLTTLCRDRCTYCTFAQPPGAGGMYLTPEEVLAVARAGRRHGCTEALFTLGDRPEDRWPQAREFLHSVGADSTLEYVVAMSRLVLEETGLFPHANPGLMSMSEMERLRPYNPSMGLMLENVSKRLLAEGMPHFDCPDKDPELRMETIANSGRLSVPFTTGVLIGIGENNQEIVDSIVALTEAHATWGSIQEVIVQNFRAKANTPMRRHAEPIPTWFSIVIALTRWFFGPEMNLQVPPNLTEHFELYLEAGINDWGGVSPLTIDWVNPEQPWPHLDELAARTSGAGYRLEPRLPVYSEFISERWIDPGLLPRVREADDELGRVAGAMA